MVKPRTRRPSSIQLSIPYYRAEHQRSPSAIEDFGYFRQASSRPGSAEIPSPAQSPQPTIMASRPPTLSEILLDVSPPPWTLSAFTAYLSHNHCMETLEFTLDAQRYASYYDKLAAENPPSPETKARVCGWWDRLMQAYIVPCAPREVNLPSRVRDHLLSLPNSPNPPHPAELEEACRKVYELMNDSLLVPFLQSVAPVSQPCPNDQVNHHHRNRPQVLPAFGDHTRRSIASPHSAEFDSLTDDSDCNSPSSAEPMTPPTTPPTSEYTFNTSPGGGGFQRAMAAHNKGWKKVGEKLGFSRKTTSRQSSSRRSTPTSSSASDYEAGSVDQNLGPPL